MILSKSDKKIARSLIDKGLELQRKQLLIRVKMMLAKWEANESDTRTTYMDLFEAVREIDKQIAQRYDGLGGSWYFDTVLAIYFDGLITWEEMEGFSEEVKTMILWHENQRK